MLAEEVDHVIGVDTHRDSNTAAILNIAGALQAQTTLATDAFGYRRLFAFARKHAPGRRCWAIEGTGSFGAGLTSFLLEHGEWVIEIDRPKRPARRNGAKSDELDAARAAREALSREHLSQPRQRGWREAMRVLLTTREGAILARTKALTHLKSLLVSAPAPLRDQLRCHPTNELVARCSRLRTSPTQTAEHRATITVLRSTARRACTLEAEAADLESQLELLLAEIAPDLLDEPGIGPISAAQLLIAYSHTGRLRSEAAFASLAGAAPIPASSGQTVRYRLNRGGDRQLNRALHTITLSRLKHHHATRAYAHRRAAEGKTTREIKRYLKRYLARQLYRQLQTNPHLNPIHKQQDLTTIEASSEIDYPTNHHPAHTQKNGHSRHPITIRPSASMTALANSITVGARNRLAPSSSSRVAQRVAAIQQPYKPPALSACLPTWRAPCRKPSPRTSVCGVYPGYAAPDHLLKLVQVCRARGCPKKTSKIDRS